MKTAKILCLSTYAVLVLFLGCGSVSGLETARDADAAAGGGTGGAIGVAGAAGGVAGAGGRGSAGGPGGVSGSAGGTAGSGGSGTGAAGAGNTTGAGNSTGAGNVSGSGNVTGSGNSTGTGNVSGNTGGSVGGGCPAGETLCGAFCVNTQSDVSACGGCDKTCNGTCSSGKCLVMIGGACTGNSQCANGYCVNSGGNMECGAKLCSTVADCLYGQPCIDENTESFSFQMPCPTGTPYGQCMCNGG